MQKREGVYTPSRFLYVVRSIARVDAEHPNAGVAAQGS